MSQASGQLTAVENFCWQRRWREFPVPNRFLGITGGDYHSVPLAAQCAMRWLAHHRRIEELRVRNLLVVCYEAFADDPAQTTRELQSFLGLQRLIPVPVVKTESLHKWREQLSAEQITQIQGVVGAAPPAA